MIFHHKLSPEDVLDVPLERLGALTKLANVYGIILKNAQEK